MNDEKPPEPDGCCASHHHQGDRTDARGAQAGGRNTFARCVRTWDRPRPAIARSAGWHWSATRSDVAIESAASPWSKGDLKGIARAIALSRAVRRNIRQNLFFAFDYNALGVPAAAGVLYPFFGILLSPMTAGAAMGLSSVSVIANALCLRKIRI